MNDTYMITGITGHLGRTIAKLLLKENKEIIGLRLPGDNEHLLEQVEYITGDVTKRDSLRPFFNKTAGKTVVFIHSAAIISTASKNADILKVNVEGTKNVISMCKEYGIVKFIYISSVHAIPEKPSGEYTTEVKEFSPFRVEGMYGKTKAQATAYVLKEIRKGFPAVVLHPSGIIGPEDYKQGYMMELIRTYLKGRLLVAIQGGYDFVDVRDVAKGVVASITKGRTGETYILSNRYFTIRELMDKMAVITGRKKAAVCIPAGIIKSFAAFIERICGLFHLPVLLTPYAAYTLSSNGLFSHEKAANELGYETRPIEATLKAAIAWLEECKGVR